MKIDIDNNVNKDIITEIIRLEWEMFNRVNNIGGRAECQNEKDTFFVMRYSNYFLFSTETLQSCLRDFKQAKSSGRNLIEEKYLYSMTINGKFRSDLYFRLNVINLSIPPLRDRKDDIYPIAEAMAERFKSEHPSNAVITHEHYEIMHAYSWPGNIRELRNIVERLLYMPGYDLNALISYWKHNSQFELNSGDFYLVGQASDLNYNDSSSSFDSKAPFDSIRLDIVLKQTGGNVSAAARHLGVSRKTLYNRIKKYGIDISRY